MGAGRPRGSGGCRRSSPTAGTRAARWPRAPAGGAGGRSRSSSGWAGRRGSSCCPSGGWSSGRSRGSVGTGWRRASTRSGPTAARPSSTRPWSGSCSGGSPGRNRRADGVHIQALSPRQSVLRVMSESTSYRTAICPPIPQKKWPNIFILLRARPPFRCCSTTTSALHISTLSPTAKAMRKHVLQPRAWWFGQSCTLPFRCSPLRLVYSQRQMTSGDILEVGKRVGILPNSSRLNS